MSGYVYIRAELWSASANKHFSKFKIPSSRFDINLLDLTCLYHFNVIPIILFIVKYTCFPSINFKWGIKYGICTVIKSN